MNLADKILENRKKLGLSQEELSEKLGVSRQSISKWESGQAKPEVDKLVQMSQLFGISLDELITNTQHTPIPDIKKPHTSKNIWGLGLIFGLTLAIMLYFFVSQISLLKDQNDLLSSQIRALNNNLDFTVLSMQRTINQLRGDLQFQNGLVADYSATAVSSNYIEESLTYKIRILPKAPESTRGILLNVTFANGSSRSIETVFTDDQYYTGFVTVPALFGMATINMSLSTESGKINQIMGTLPSFAAPAISLNTMATLHESDNILAFPKGNIELLIDLLCSDQRDAFEGTYSFRIIRNEAVNPAFSYNWASNGPDTTCSKQTDTMATVVSTKIPVTKAFNLDFKIGDVITMNLVWIAEGKEKSIAIQTFTRKADGSMAVAYYQQ